MNFLRGHIHIMRPGKLYQLQVPLIGSMSHWTFQGKQNFFTVGGAQHDMLQCPDLLPEHIRGTVLQDSVNIVVTGNVQVVFPDNRKVELQAGQTIAIPLAWTPDIHSIRWKMIIGDIIVRVEILPETENIPQKLHKYLEIQYGKMEKIQEGRSCLIYRTNNSQIIKLLRPSHTKIRGVPRRFINAARKFCMLPEHLFLKVEEIVYRRELFLAYVVMQYFPGETLENYLARKGVLQPNEAVYLIRTLAQNLLVLQRHQYCCRNLTPENILIDEMNRLRITGFFLLKSLDQNLTMPGAQMVIPKYTAPEQVDNPMEADIYSDIFSLGAIFYQMLLGEPPLNFNQAKQYIEFLKTGRGILSDDIQTKAPGLSSQLCDLIASMISLDKRKRPNPEQLLSQLSDHHLVMTKVEDQEAATWETEHTADESSMQPVVFEDDQDDPEAVAAAQKDAHLFISTQQRKSAPTIPMQGTPTKILGDEISMPTEQAIEAVPIEESALPATSYQEKKSIPTPIKTGTPTPANPPPTLPGNRTQREDLTAQENELIAQSFQLEETKTEDSVSFSALVEFDLDARLPSKPGDHHGFTLKVVQGPESSRPLEYHFKGDRQIVIGREADFCIRNDTLISRAHARLEMIEGEWWITDLRSRNGVTIQGKKVNREKIVPGTEFTVGETTLRFQKNTTVSEMWEDQDLSEAAIASAREIRITRMYPVVTALQASGMNVLPSSITKSGSANTNTAVASSSSNTPIVPDAVNAAPAPDTAIPPTPATAESANNKPGQAKAISSTLIRRPPKPQEHITSASWAAIDHADDADKVLNEVYQEFQETAIRSNNRAARLVQFDEPSMDKLKKAALISLLLLVAFMILAVMFLIFLWKF